MEVITMESAAYQGLVTKIEKIAEYVFRKGNAPDVEEIFGWIAKKWRICCISAHEPYNG